MSAATILPVIWYFIIGFAVLMYVLLDGFVLGIGIISPFADNDQQRDIMMSTAAPIWDGNETWLVLGGAGLMAAFPKVYALVLSSLYLPVLLMLVGIIMRGVSFEFRSKANSSRWVWGFAFCFGSILCAFMQGIILGSLVEGMPLLAHTYIDLPAFIWFSPFAILTGVAVVFGYALLGSTWVILKTTGDTQLIAHHLARPLMMVVLAFMLLVSCWLPFLDTRIMHKWFSWPSILYLSPIPILTIINALFLWLAVIKKHEYTPFILSLTLFFLGFIGLVVGMWPNLVPPNMSLWDAASPVESQTFLLVGVVIMIPIILINTAFSYYVFRGKVTEHDKFY